MNSVHFIGSWTMFRTHSCDKALCERAVELLEGGGRSAPCQRFISIRVSQMRITSVHSVKPTFDSDTGRNLARSLSVLEQQLDAVVAERPHLQERLNALGTS